MFLLVYYYLLWRYAWTCVGLSVHLCLCLHICQFACLSVHLFISTSVRVSAHLSVCMDRQHRMQSCSDYTLLLLTSPTSPHFLLSHLIISYLYLNTPMCCPTLSLSSGAQQGDGEERSGSFSHRLFLQLMRLRTLQVRTYVHTST